VKSKELMLAFDILQASVQYDASCINELILCWFMELLCRLYIWVSVCTSYMEGPYGRKALHDNGYPMVALAVWMALWVSPHLLNTRTHRLSWRGICTGRM